MHKKKLLILALSAVIFFTPSNWFFVLTTQGSYVHGLQVDYLLPKLYASLLVALIFILLWLWNYWALLPKICARYSRILLLSSTGILYSGVRQLFTPHPLHGLWFLLQLIITVLFALTLFHQRSLLKTKLIQVTLLGTLSLQFLLGCYQFFTQKTLAGYWLLGEPQLTQPYGLASDVFNGVEKVLAYGTTPHPNILAGVLISLALLGTLLLQNKPSKHALAAMVLLLGLAAATTYITQSFSGLLVLTSGLMYLFFSYYKKSWSSRILLSLIVIGAVCTPLVISQLESYSEAPSIKRRAVLNTAAWELFTEHPLQGTGLNTFTRYVEEVGSAETVRFVQPAHHTFLLVLVEDGLLSVTLIGALIVLLPLKVRRALVLTTAVLLGPLVLDHYLYTLPQGLLLVALLVAGIAVHRETME
jgi:hypothetical protein